MLFKIFSWSWSAEDDTTLTIKSLNKLVSNVIANISYRKATYQDTIIMSMILATPRKMYIPRYMAILELALFALAAVHQSSHTAVDSLVWIQLFLKRKGRTSEFTAECPKQCNDHA